MSDRVKLPESDVLLEVIELRRANAELERENADLERENAELSEMADALALDAFVTVRAALALLLSANAAFRECPPTMKPVLRALREVEGDME